MTRVLIVTGTDTGVGKTVATAALAAAALHEPAPHGAAPHGAALHGAAIADAEAPGRTTPPADSPNDTDGSSAVSLLSAGGGLGGGARVAVVKPAQTGVLPDEPGDLDEVRRLAGVTDLHEGIRLREPLAPTTAGRREGVALPSVDAHARAIDELAADRDLVLVEGAGGLLVGLDDDGRDLSDLAARLTVPFAFVVVTRPGLGTLNHTGLTVEALRRRNLPIAGLVIGSWPEAPDLAEQCNLDDLPAVTGVPVIGRIPADAGRLDHETFTTAAPTWFHGTPPSAWTPAPPPQSPTGWIAYPTPTTRINHSAPADGAAGERAVGDRGGEATGGPAGGDGVGGGSGGSANSDRAGGEG